MVGGSDPNRSHFPMITYQAIALIEAALQALKAL